MIDLKTLALILATASLSIQTPVSAAAKNGAIAYSSSTSRYGIAVNAATPVKAQAIAIGACGQSDCIVKFTFLNCGAIASNNKKIGFGKAPNLKDAQIQALAASGARSKVLTSGCNSI
jgi:hypothetical protein